MTLHPLLRSLRMTLAAGLVALTACAAAQNDTTKDSAPMKPFLPYLVGRDIPEELRALEEQGNISEAESWLAAQLAGDGLDQATARAYTIERERLRRLRIDYSKSADQMLQKIQNAIPDATRADLDAWTRDREILWLEIDGKTFYFGREPGNLFRKNKQARDRRDAAAKKKSAAGDVSADDGVVLTLVHHLDNVMKVIRARGGDRAVPVTLRVTHKITVKPDLVPAGKTIRCWMPFPKEYRQQTDARMIASEPANARVAPNDAGQRTAYMEKTAVAGKSTEFSIDYEYKTSAYVPKIEPEKVTPLDPNGAIAREYLAQRPPHILQNPEVMALAKQIVGDETNPYLKASKILKWMDANIHWTPEMEYSILPSAIEKVMAERRGDCGIQGLMFINLCRASGVPARWQSGWMTRPGTWNLHDWTEFYVEPYGWIPGDPSFGLQKSDDPEVHDFYIGHIDSFRMIANTDYGVDFDPPKTFWRSDPVDNQRGEIEWEGGNLYYGQWSDDVTIYYNFE